MASRSLNKVMLIGNLTRDPELRYTPSGTAVCTFGLATNRSWTTDSGERKEDVEFHRIVAWQKLAEICAKFLFKGKKTYIEGRLQTRSWTGQDGKERQSTEIVIDDMILLEGRREEDGVKPRSAFAESKAENKVEAPKIVAEGHKETPVKEKEDDKKEPVKKDKNLEKKEESKKASKNEIVTDDEIAPEDIPF